MDIAILGSCVTRDAFELYKNEFKIEKYFARTSIISLASEPIDINMDKLKNKSNFRAKCVYNDINKTLFKELEEYQSKYFIIDFIDERFDLVKINNSIITHSNELVESEFLDDKEYNIINRKILDFELWKKSADIFIKKLTQKYEGKNIVLHKAFFTETYIDEGEIKDFEQYELGFARRINNILDRYYNYIENNIKGINIIYINNAKASKQHKWGLAPYHYTEDYYVEFIEKFRHIIKVNSRDFIRQKIRDLRLEVFEDHFGVTC